MAEILNEYGLSGLDKVFQMMLNQAMLVESDSYLNFFFSRPS